MKKHSRIIIIFAYAALLVAGFTMIFRERIFKEKSTINPESSLSPKVEDRDLKIILIENRSLIYLLTEDKAGIRKARQVPMKDKGQIYGRSVFIDRYGNLEVIRESAKKWYIDTINIYNAKSDSRHLMTYYRGLQVRDTAFSNDGKALLINKILFYVNIGSFDYENIDSIAKKAAEKSPSPKKDTLPEPIYSGISYSMQVSPDKKFISFIEFVEACYRIKEKKPMNFLRVYDIKSRKQLLSIKVGFLNNRNNNQVWSPSGEKILFVRESPVNDIEICTLDISSKKIETLLKSRKKPEAIDLDWRKSGMVITDNEKGIFYAKGEKGKYKPELLKMPEVIGDYRKARISPDGSRIMFFGRKNGELYLFIYNLRTESLSGLKLVNEVEEYMGGWIDKGKDSIIIDEPKWFSFWW